MLRGVSGVECFINKNSFYKNETSIFLISGCTSWGLSLFSVVFNLLELMFSARMAAVKCRPVLHHCVVISNLFSRVMGCVCLHLKIECRTCARGRQWCDIFHFHWWTASINRCCCFSHAGCASEGILLS